MQPSPARIAACLALALPVIAGIAWMAFAGAPAHYLAINGASLALAFAWIAFGRAPSSPALQRGVVLFLLAILFVPLATGPWQEAIGGRQVSRWLPAGPFMIHAGLLAFPTLAILAARDEGFAPPILFTALLAASLQPDAGTAFAITFAAVGLHDATRDWRIGLVAIVGFVAAIVAALKGELPPVPFVERVFHDALRIGWPAAIVLGLALITSLVLVLRFAPFARRERYAAGGALFGFTLAAVINHYPTPLVGYGAASILGFGLALGFAELRLRAQTSSG